MDIRSLITRLGYKVDTRGLNQGEKAVGRYARNVKRLALGAIAAVGGAVVGIGAASIKSAAEMESINAAFEVMLGNAEDAKKLVAELTDMSDFTPFQALDLANASRMLLNFGIASKDLMGTLRMLGDVAGSDRNKLMSLARAFGQLSSAGKANLEDINQMIDAGFNPLQVIAEKTGESMGALRDRVSKGKVSVQEIARAFKIATSEGGRFFNNMQKQSETLGGIWSTLWGMVTRVRIMIGEKLSPTIKAFLTDAINGIRDRLIPAMKAWFDTLEPLVWMYEDLKTILKALPGFVQAIGEAFGPEIELMKELTSSVLDLWLSVADAIYTAVGAVITLDDSLSAVGWVVDKIGMIIRGWVGMIKIATAGFRMLSAYIKGEEGLVAQIDVKLKEDLADLFKEDIVGERKAAGERINELRETLGKGFSNLNQTLAAQRKVRIQNVKIDVKQTNKINAPAAKDGTTGLSAQGLDASLRKAQTALWASQLNKLTTAAIGS
jgi:tape measure domain-containing protein